MIRYLPIVTAAIVLAWMPPAALRAEDNLDLPPSHSVKPELYATGFEFAEGPALDRHGNLYVVNYRGNGNIGRITRDGTAGVLCTLDTLVPAEGRRSRANGIKIDGVGRLIVADAGGGRLLRIDADGTKAEVLADRFQGKLFSAINDVALDLDGNIFFTDPGGSSLQEPIGSVYRYDIATKQVSRLDTGLAFPNGVGVTPDQAHLCVAESRKMRILIYDLSAEGEATDRRTLIDFPAETDGILRGGDFAPDGFVFDAKGRLFVAMFSGGVINVVDVPSGKLVRQYDAGGTRSTNCHFSGPYLYTTVASKEAVFRLKLNLQGFAYYGPE